MILRLIVPCLIGSIALTPIAASQQVNGIEEIEPLTFGSIIATSSGAVTVAANGAYQTSGGVLVPGGGQFSGPSPAMLSVSLQPGYAYSITLPADHASGLTNGTQTLSLSEFESTPSGSITPNLSAQILHVGAKLNIPSNVSAGDFTGSFAVIVAYE